MDAKEALKAIIEDPSRAEEVYSELNDAQAKEFTKSLKSRDFLKIASDTSLSNEARIGAAQLAILSEAKDVKKLNGILLVDKDDDFRCALAGIIEMFNLADESIMALAKNKGGSITLRSSVIRALGTAKIDNKEAMDLYVSAMHEMDEDIRIAGMDALARTCDGKEYRKATEKHLIRFLEKEKSLDIRRKAAWVLGEIGTKDAIPALKKRSSSDNVELVRNECQKSIGKIEKRQQFEKMKSTVR
jgi:hypothetical protein